MCAEGKGLLRPWGWNGCRNAEAGKRLILSDWPPPFLTHCGRGKPQGCMEPAEAVLKGKPHAFESWSGHLYFFNSLQFSPHSLRCCCTWRDLSSIRSVKPLIPAALLSLTYLLINLDLLNKER